MNIKEKIEYVNVSNLVPFTDHPFKSRDGEEKELKPFPWICKYRHENQN